MSIIDELLSAPSEEEVWEVDNRYAINSSYIDDQGPVEIIGKDIGDMSSQISIQGESMSQYVEFRMPRYYDNIDLSEKTLSVHYEINGVGGEIAPMNVYKSQERIKFGWVLPAAALQTFGLLSISVWARGYVNTEEYIWKSRTASYVIEKGLMIGGGIPEPDENWYLEFVRQMDVRVAEASLYASRAKQSESSASSSEFNARTYMETASTGASTAVQKAGEALNSASAASTSSVTAQESATLAMEYRDGAEEYYERTKGIAEGLSGQLVPMGTVTFENLPALEDVVAGWMYNISNEFTTTSQFKEGAGKVIPLGSNVYKTTDGYWDVLAGSPVSGVKGSAETVYRSGNVNITPANLGITVVNNTRDEDKNVSHSRTSDSAAAAERDSLDNILHEHYASKNEASISGTATGTNPTIQDSTNAPFIYGKFKGYTLQDGEPTPDNSIHVDGLGDKGYFDGMLLQGAYNPSTGAYGSANLFLCNKNGIPCKEGDVIRIAYEGEADHVRALFYNDDTFVSQTYSNGNLHTDTVPSGVNVVKFNVYNASGITPSTAKHISVTINGKYAIEVKTIGKNMLNNIAVTKTINGVTFTVNNDKSITANGTATADAIISVGNFKPKPNKTYIFTSNSKTLSNSEYWRAFSYIENIDGVNTWRSDSPNNNYSYEFTPLTDTTLYNNIYIESGMTVNNLKFYPMIRPAEVTDDTYEPYQGETTATIPTEAPLYEGDYIEVYADGSGKLVRAMAEVVFDGSSDEGWRALGDNVYQTANTICGNANFPMWNQKTKQKSTHFSVGAAYQAGNDCFSINNSGNMAFRYNSTTTLDEFVAWLQSNPITVVYELAEPTEIELTAEQVAEFKKLYTFEPITNVVCDGEVEMIYFRNNPNGRVAGMLQRQIDSITSALSAEAEES